MRVDVGGDPVLLGSRKAMALLAYLCRRGDTPVPRETLSGLLWGDSAEEQARASLRQTLSGLRKGLGDAAQHALRVDATSLAVNTAAARIDATDFERTADVDAIEGLERAGALYGGEFLEGLGPVSPEFDRWAAAERATLRSRHAGALLRLTDLYSAAGRTEEMIATAQRLLVLDPLQEHVHRRLMRAYLVQKRYDAALRQFDDLRKLLADELGVSPEPPTLDLIREVRRVRSGHAAPQPDPGEATPPTDTALVPSGRPSIAVMPFRSLAETTDAVFLGEGIAEDVIIELSREPDIMVMSRQSSFRFNSEADDAAVIGRTLGVRFLLGGTVRIAGDRLRVTAHLVHGETGREIWAERFDRDLKDIFAIQTEIARTVTGTVVGRIADTEVRASLDRPKEHLESFVLVLRGLRHMHAYTYDDYGKAVDYFERATKASPDYGRAWGLLAISLIYQQWNFADRGVRDILPVGERAIALDPRDGKGHCALGLGHLILRNFDKAGFHFEAGLAANPNDDLLLTEYGRYLMYIDRPEEGLRRVREGMRLNPFHPNWYWNLAGRCLHTIGRYDEALEAFQHVLNPPYYTHAYMAACHARLGNREAADAARAALFQAYPDFGLATFTAILPYKNPATLQRFAKTLADAGLGQAP